MFCYSLALSTREKFKMLHAMSLGIKTALYEPYDCIWTSYDCVGPLKETYKILTGGILWFCRILHSGWLISGS